MSNTERRHYQRVSFETTALLTNESQSFACQVVDLSIKGVLLRPHGVLNSSIGSEFALAIPLGSSTSENVEMRIKLAHKTPECLGFECLQIDVESITHLRRILELNSGDGLLLERELKNLICA